MATKYKQGKDGYWSTLVWDGTYTTGKNGEAVKHRKQIRSNKSSKDLELKVAEFQQKVNNRQNEPTTNITFLDYARQWRKLYKSNVRLNTQVMYDNVIEAHFSKLEGVLLKDINKNHLFSLMSETSARTGRNIYMTFNQVIKEAVRQRYLPLSRHEDIFADTSAPKVKSAPKRALTLAEKDAILNTTLEGMDKAYLWIAYACGLRREEILALTKKDIDTHIRINKVIVFDVNDPILELDVKSENGLRSVPIPSFAQEFLKEYCKTVKNQLFYTAGKEYMTKSTYTKMWARILRSLNKQLEEGTDITSHYLRHNYVTMLCYQVPKVSIKTIAKLAGDSEAVIIRIYNHIQMELEDQVGAIESAFAPAAPKKPMQYRVIRIKKKSTA